MTQNNQKVIAITPFWASILSGLIVLACVGGFAYAWNANADISVLKRDVSEMKLADTSTRLTRLEERSASIQKSLDRIEGKIDMAATIPKTEAK